MKTITILLVLLLMAFSYQQADAYICHVPDDSSTIQDCINAVSDGDTVLVDRGTYYENIDFEGRNILVASNYINDGLQATIDSTIINGGGLGRVVEMQSVMGANAGIIGFTLINGRADIGGGIYCYLSSARISHNVITGDTADCYGGGICVRNCSPVIDSNLILGNEAYNGGGIKFSDSSSGGAFGNLIRNNHAQNGGGIQVSGGSSPTINNNTIEGNAAVYGGGIECGGRSHPSIIDNIISANSSTNLGGGLAYWFGSSPHVKGNYIIGNQSPCGAGIYARESHATVVFNIIADNSAPEGGGGITSLADTSLIHNNTFDNNSGADGARAGGICCWSNAVPEIKNNIIVNSPVGYGIGCSPGSNPVISYNDVCNNENGNFYGCPPGVGDTSWGENFNKTPCDSFYNIIVEPLFKDPANANYALLCSSECIDAGDTNFPPLAVGGAKIDQGAFEYPYILGDANGDGIIDAGDIPFLINYLYLGCKGPCPWRAGDANCDTIVDAGDIVRLIDYVFCGGQPPDCEDCKSGRMKPEISFQSLKSTRDLSWVGFAAPAKLSDGLVELSITGGFDTEILAVDLEIECDPDEIQLLNLELADMTEHLQIYYGFKDGILRIGVFDMYGKHSIAPGQGTLVTLRIKGTDPSSLTISTVTLVGRNAQKIPVRIVSEVKHPVDDFTARKPAIPEEFSLSQNYPNPFNPETEISYELPTDCRVNVSVYNIRGQKVKTLVDEFEAAGHKTVRWDGTDGNGKKMASGIYFYRIQADEFTGTKKMILMK